jgi:hypothetical protein
MFGKDGKYEQGSQLCGKIVVAGSLSFAGADHLVLFLKGWVPRAREPHGGVQRLVKRLF